MKSHSLLFVLVLGFIGILASCRNDLIPSPVIDDITSGISANTTLEAPHDVSASHGLAGKVHLTWGTVLGAVHYNIYSANDAYSTMVQIGETKDSTCSFDAAENDGVTKYYCIAAVNYDKKVSKLSSKAYGSTLAKPIIDSIEQIEGGNSVKVHWYMDNCKETTYLSKVLYQIDCYDADKKPVKELTASGETTSIIFEGLEPSTNYFFKVIAYTDSNQDSTVESDMLDQETAHKLIPNPVDNFEIKKGQSTQQIILSWDLPDFVDFRLSQDSYESHPVYFTIERKEIDAPDSEYQKIANYIGSQIPNTINSDEALVEAANNKLFYFDLINEADPLNSANISVIPSTDATLQNTNYPNYIPTSKIFFTDTNGIERGVQYSYRIQSYVDDAGTSIISSTTTQVTDTGWLIGNATIKAKAEYTSDLEDEFKIVDIKVNFTIDFEDFGLTDGYNYILTSTKTGFADGAAPEPETLMRITPSLNTIKNYQTDFSSDDLSDANIASVEGYYKYTLYIAPVGTSDIPAADQFFIKAESPNAITVTNDKSLMPTVENFSVKDGYANKFVITWDYDSNCSYTLSWIEYKNSTTEVDDAQAQTIALDASALTLTHPDAERTVATYEHAALSGECRAYTIIANNGFEASKEYLDGEDHTIVSCTLGTVKPVMADPDYSKITVTWPKVQRAKAETTDFTVKAYYSDDSNKIDLVNASEESGVTTVTYNEETQLYTCVITKPEGYNDASKSGKAITLEVTATSDDDSLSQDNTTTCDYTVKTMGPAMTDTAIGAIQHDRILLNWKKIPDANGYIIHRIRYTDGAGTTPAAQTDTYYYDGSKLYIQGDEVSTNRASVNLAGNTYELRDIYYEAEDSTSSYQINQGMISWGLPYGYIVLPLKNGGTSDDFIFDGKTLTEESAVTYTNMTEDKTATFGYGLNLWARKAENNTTQTIEWDKPYYGDKTPYLYSRVAGDPSNIWYKHNDTITSTTLNFSPEDVTEAYEYIIAYNKSSPTIALPESLVNNDSVGLSKLDTDHYSFGSNTPEKMNKGYLLAVNFNAQYGGTKNSDGSYANDSYYYSEKVNWNEWDYSKRSLGPTSAYISIKNYNLSSSWTKLASLDTNLHFESKETLTNTTIKNNGDVELYLKPTTVANDSTLLTAGVLQVLRDAKHYYGLTLIRGSTSVIQGEDDSIYAYRQISETELIRSAMIQMNDVMQKIDKLDITNEADNGDISGAFNFTQEKLTSSKYFYSITNYSSSMTTPANKQLASFMITIPYSTMNRGASWWGSYATSFDSTTITVKPNDSKNTLESYFNTISFSISSHSSASLSCGSTSVPMSSDSIRRKWIPFILDGDENWYHDDPTYGWWN